jgi:hypothetical protein
MILFQKQYDCLLVLHLHFYLLYVNIQTPAIHHFAPLTSPLWHSEGGRSPFALFFLYLYNDVVLEFVFYLFHVRRVHDSAVSLSLGGQR